MHAFRTCQSLPTLQRGLSAIADLLVKSKVLAYHSGLHRFEVEKSTVNMQTAETWSNDQMSHTARQNCQTDAALTCRQALSANEENGDWWWRSDTLHKDLSAAELFLDQQWWIPTSSKERVISRLVYRSFSNSSATCLTWPHICSNS